MPPHHLFVLVALAIAVSSGCAAAEDCTLSKDAVHSYLDLRSPKIAKVISTRRPDPQKLGARFEQTVKLTSGKTVTFAVYGCEYLAWSLSFRALPGVTKSTPLRELARIAREQVASVPMQELPLGDPAEALTEDVLAKAEGGTMARMRFTWTMPSTR